MFVVIISKWGSRGGPYRHLILGQFDQCQYEMMSLDANDATILGVGFFFCMNVSENTEAVSSFQFNC